MQSLQASAELFYIILFKKNEFFLEWNLIAQSEHNHAVLAFAVGIFLLAELRQSEVVTGVNYEIAEVVRSTQRN